MHRYGQSENTEFSKFVEGIFQEYDFPYISLNVPGKQTKKLATRVVLKETLPLDGILNIGDYSDSDMVPNFVLIVTYDNESERLKISDNSQAFNYLIRHLNHAGMLDGTFETYLRDMSLCAEMNNIDIKFSINRGIFSFCSDFAVKRDKPMSDTSKKWLINSANQIVHSTYMFFGMHLYGIRAAMEYDLMS